MASERNRLGVAPWGHFVVHAPADLVLQVVRAFGMKSIPAAHAIFWLCTTLLRTRVPTPRRGAGLADSIQLTAP